MDPLNSANPRVDALENTVSQLQERVALLERALAHPASPAAPMLHPQAPPGIHYPPQPAPGPLMSQPQSAPMAGPSNYPPQPAPGPLMPQPQPAPMAGPSGYSPQPAPGSLMPQLQTAPIAGHALNPALSPQLPAAPPGRSMFDAGRERGAEFWLNRLGIGLFILGVLFFFNYSIERGWLTPPLRVLAGLLTGGALLAGGWSMRKRRTALSQTLQGGGLAVLLASVFASHNFYQLIGFVPAFVGMTLITLLGFGLAWRYAWLSLGMIALLGGFVTPVILQSDTSSASGLLIYTLFIALLGQGLYMRRGWLSLLVVNMLGSGLLVVVALSMGDAADQWLIQGLLIGFWLLFWLTTTAYALLVERGRLSPPPVSRIFASMRPTPLNLAHWQSFISAMMLVFFSAGLWSRQQNGLLALLLAGVYGLALAGLWRRSRPLAITQLLTSAALVALSAGFLLHGDVLFLALGLETALLYGLAWRLQERSLERAGWAATALVVVLLLNRIARIDYRLTPFVNPAALSDLAVLVLLGLASLRLRSLPQRWYQAGFALLAGYWVAMQLEQSTMAVLMLAAAGYALILHALGAYRRHLELALIGIGGLALLAVGLWLPIIDPGLLVSPPFFNAYGIASLIAAATALICGQTFVLPVWRSSYRLAAYVAWLWIILIQFSPLKNGNAFTSIGWVLTVIILFVVALQTNRMLLLRTAMVTIAVIVGKLFVIDLVGVDAIWRIALFLGAGGVFLLMSFLFPHLWRRSEP